MRRFILPLLIALLLGAAGFGVAQLSEAQGLRASLASLGQDRDGLRKKVWDLQKLNDELAARLDRGRGPNGPGNRAEGEAGPDEPGATAARERARQDGNRFNAILNSPEVQRLMALQQKAGLDNRYAALFKRLNLSPAELEKFKSLLVEKQSSVMDVMQAARTQGLDGRGNRDEIRQLVQDAQAEVDNTIRATLGEAGFAQYKSYETTLPQRNLVDQLGQRLSYSTTPLTDTQADQMVQILAATTATSGNNGGGNRNPMATAFVSAVPGAAMMFGGGTKITDATITQAQGVLSAQQLAALQSLQQEQQAAAQLAEQMRANRQNQPRTTTGTGTTARPPGGG